MNRSELVENIAQKAGISYQLADDVAETFFQTVTEALAEGNRVEIRGFGAFSVKNYEAYVGRNPKTGDKIQVQAKKLPIWRTGAQLRSRVDD